MSETKVVKIVELTDWELVCLFNYYGSGKLDLSSRILNKCMDITWNLQDGYGEPGFTPPQGWDWSGIRDSSSVAKKAMADALRTYLRTALKTDSVTVRKEI